MADPITELLGTAAPVVATDGHELSQPIAEAPRPLEPKREDDDGGVFEAHQRRQAMWEQDAKELFRGPSEDERRREKLLEDIARIDAEKRAELEASEKIKREAAERATAAEKAAELRAKAKALRAEAKDADTEAARLEKIVKE